MLKKLLNIVAATALTASLAIGTQGVVFADSTFFGLNGSQGGNFYIAGNTTNPQLGWSDPANANVGDIVEFQGKIFNEGTAVAQNVQVKADLPTGVTGSSISTTLHIKADNAPEVTDTATIDFPNDGNPHSLVYFPGHALLDTVNGTNSVEAIGGGGWVNIGNLQTGDGNGDYLTFKATLTETTPSPSPTPTPTPTPTVTPTPSPSQVGVVACPAGFVSQTVGSVIMCVQQQQSVNVTNNNTNNNNNSSNNSNTVTVQAAAQPAPVAPKVVTVAATPVKQLPSTGLPFGGLALSGLAPVGWALRKFGHGKEDASDALPYLISKARESKKFFS